MSAQDWIEKDFYKTLGVEKSAPLHRFLNSTPSSRFEATSGKATLCGLAVDVDDRTGLATKVSAIRLGPHLEEAWPRHWEWECEDAMPNALSPSGERRETWQLVA